MTLKKLFLFLTAIALAAQLFSANADSLSIDGWNNRALDAIRASRTPPPMAAYALALFHLSLYDTVNGFHGDFQHYLVEPNSPEGASLEAAYHTAAYETLADLFNESVNPTVFRKAYQMEIKDLPRDEAFEKGVAWGQEVASAYKIVCDESRKYDAVEWTTVADAGVWRETPPFFRPALLPHWPHVKPLAMDSPDAFRCPAPPAIDSEEYAAEWAEVKALGGRDKHDRSGYDTLSSVFWSDDLGSSTPAGTWNLIAQEVYKSQSYDFYQQVRLYALLNLTMADAGIACWDAKYYYNYWRPETAIRQADIDDNSATEKDENWIPLMGSPPFPEYPSGHSSFSRSAAELLTLYCERDDIAFSTTSDQVPGAIRSYPGFDACATEVGMSRLHGGIHFMSANLVGQELGANIAKFIHQNFLLPKE
ncbi:phosphatase PAP2 family protein [Pelagicoccus sp. SDUM812002]|uniref:vanadium-dependent haloperoxidase n=1 Tax=Pelagicoccus sp. SDUM812002 TaxID=3041266 RepID=UPI00280CDBF4|nr:phosphatase PAP2 family protein [Pelagicoccus sp. SDUM812002]MDQ8187185.1 phosphatase PAP2 family protein [Pelagicoccus sp. SDUM812002]